MNQMGEDRVERLKALEPATVMSGFRSGAISRRDLSKLFAALGLTSALGSVLAQESARGQSNELTMVIWEGYAAPAFAEKFEEENDATINATPMSSSDDAFARLQAGGGSNFDLVSASNDVSQRLIDAGLVQAIDPTRLTNYDDLYEQFQYPSYITKDDELYG